jgi:hypothetical protein
MRWGSPRLWKKLLLWKKLVGQRRKRQLARPAHSMKTPPEPMS